jgi:hypothetical protein
LHIFFTALKATPGLSSSQESGTGKTTVRDVCSNDTGKTDIIHPESKMTIELLAAVCDEFGYLPEATKA